MDETLKRAAREGNVSDLYTLIQKDGNVLKRLDKVEFIDTPLHIPADAGCIDFAMEIMSLKPSFARKLNQQGLSPIHLAVEKGNKELVLYLMENAKDLVRVKGKKASAVFIVTFFLRLGLLKPFPRGFRTALQGVPIF
ncbi:hypothetical protein DITRI_Ditri09bG0119000 [Diplodiscus trichospermus]